MDVTADFKQIVVFVDQERFISALVEMAGALIFAVE